MRRRVRWHDRRSGSFSGSSFTAGPEVKRVIAPKALDRFQQRIREITRRGQGRQHENDDGGVGSVYAGLAQQLFRILRNARGADRFNPLGPVATQGGFVAAVENTAPSPGSSAGTGSTSAAGQQYGWQWAWPLVHSRRPKRSLWGFLMRTSNRSDFRHCSRIVSVTISNRRVRTRTHGGVAGARAGDCRPYADQLVLCAAEIYAEYQFGTNDLPVLDQNLPADNSRASPTALINALAGLETATMQHTQSRYAAAGGFLCADWAQLDYTRSSQIPPSGKFHGLMPE